MTALCQEILQRIHREFFYSLFSFEEFNANYVVLDLQKPKNQVRPFMSMGRWPVVPEKWLVEYLEANPELKEAQVLFELKGGGG